MREKFSVAFSVNCKLFSFIYFENRTPLIMLNVNIFTEECGIKLYKIMCGWGEDNHHHPSVEESVHVLSLSKSHFGKEKKYTISRSKEEFTMHFCRWKQ